MKQDIYSALSGALEGLEEKRVPLETPPSGWDKAWKLITDVFTPEFWKKFDVFKPEGKKVGEDLETIIKGAKPTIQADAEEYFTTHQDCSPEEMVSHLKSKGWTSEKIRSLGGILKGVE